MRRLSSFPHRRAGHAADWPARGTADTGKDAGVLRGSRPFAQGSAVRGHTRNYGLMADVELESITGNRIASSHTKRA